MTDRIALAERLDTAAATALASNLSKVPASSHCVLDASAVTHFGAQALQVVISAQKTFGAAGGKIELVDVNERAAAQLEDLGLTAADLSEGFQ